MRGDIQVQALGYRYDDGTAALHELSFQIAAGECVALIGANGAGKSTLLLNLAGQLMPTEGEVRVAGHRVLASQLTAVRQALGLVFQDPDDQLFMPTVEEDVAFGPRNQGLNDDEVEQRVTAALGTVGLEAVRHRPPFRLSGGEKKRAAIAGVLAMQPPILVLDEPTSGLDPWARRQLMQLLATLKQTRLIASHDVDLVLALCSRCLLMADGRVVADGPTGEILSDAALLARCRLEPPLALQACPVCSAHTAPIASFNSLTRKVS
jgi:cobalt/nickel transport system ATP-binding protein